MKLKGLTKLALSGVALAAVAATLGTSTYAWYISNDTATVSGAQGATASASATGSIYAASPIDYHNGDWKNEISLVGGSASDISGYTADYNNTVQLNPVTKATAALTSTYNTKAGASSTATDGDFVDAEGNVQSSAYLEFSFYLIQRGAAAGQVSPKLTITNKTAIGSAKKQTAYANNNLPTTDADGTVSPAIGNATGRTKTFAVDAVRALRIEISNSAAYTTKAAAAATTPDSTKLFATTTYAADVIADDYESPEGYVYNGKANQYYNEIVKGVNLYGCGAASTTAANLCMDVDAPSTPWADFYLTKDVETLLTFKVWLEGTDCDCYDSCIAQTFDFNFEFQLIKETN